MGKTTLGLSKSEQRTHTPHPTWLLLVLYLLMSANVLNSINRVL